MCLLLYLVGHTYLDSLFKKEYEEEVDELERSKSNSNYHGGKNEYS